MLCIPRARHSQAYEVSGSRARSNGWRKVHRAQGKGKHTRPALAVESTVQDRLITHAQRVISLLRLHFNFSSPFLQGFRRVWLGRAVDSGPDGCMHDSVLRDLTRLTIDI